MRLWRPKWAIYVYLEPETKSVFYSTIAGDLSPMSLGLASSVCILGPSRLCFARFARLPRLAVVPESHEACVSKAPASIRSMGVIIESTRWTSETQWCAAGAMTSAEFGYPLANVKKCCQVSLLSVSRSIVPGHHHRPVGLQRERASGAIMVCCCLVRASFLFLPYVSSNHQARPSP